MAFTRDPVSVLFDRGAAELLARAYARPGQWVATRLTAPGLRHQVWARAQGIEPYSRDRWGMQRWPRAFVRSVYYRHQWYYSGTRRGLGDRRRAEKYTGLAIKVEVGPLVYVGAVRGWRVRIRVLPGGAAARAAVRRQPAARRYTENPALLSEPATRDWASTG